MSVEQQMIRARMAYDVFVSHSGADRVLADAIVHELEAAGIGCWIAPRNILPGTNYGEAIVAAIQNVDVMVVVVSDDANRSGHVQREVERAAAHNVSLVPLRIADIEPSSSLEYFLSCQHWLHALPPPLEAHLTRLVDAVQALLALRRAPHRAGRRRWNRNPPCPDSGATIGHNTRGPRETRSESPHLLPSSRRELPSVPRSAGS